MDLISAGVGISSVLTSSYPPYAAFVVIVALSLAADGVVCGAHNNKVIPPNREVWSRDLPIIIFFNVGVLAAEVLPPPAPRLRGVNKAEDRLTFGLAPNER